MTPHPRSTRRLPVVPAVLAGVVLAAVVALVATRSSGDGESEETPVTASVQQTRPVTTAGDPLPPLQDEAGRDPAVGVLIPDVRGQSFDGTPVAITKDGRPKLIAFLAHWCPHCQKEVPVIARWLADKGGPEGVDLYAVSTSVRPQQPNYPPSRWLERERFGVVTLADDQQGTASLVFGLTAFPYFVAVDGSGKVVARATGELPVEDLELLVTAARGG